LVAIKILLGGGPEMTNRKTTVWFWLAAIGFVLAACGGGGGGDGTGSGGSVQPPATYSISGSVLSWEEGVPGVTVTLTGTDNATTTTGADGSYSFTGLSNGTYTITPTKTGFSSRPRNNEQIVAGDNVDNIDFTMGSSILYITDNTGTLAKINIEDDNVTIIGDITERTTDIAMDTMGILLYGINNDNVFTINKDNAATTLVGSHGLVSSSPALAFDRNGTLYAVNSRLYTISLDNGSFIDNVGNAGTLYRASGGLAFLDNALFLTSSVGGDPAATDNLVRLDTATGAGTIIGNTGYQDVYGLATNDGVTLYGISGTQIITIDTGTGEAAVLLDYGPSGLNSGLGAGQGLTFGSPGE
jgi:hypothetical protein